MGNLGFFAAGLLQGRDFKLNCCYLKKLGMFGSKHGTKVYAFAYDEGRLEKVQTSKDGLYHFLP